jgi:hypothetical protein
MTTHRSWSTLNSTEHERFGLMLVSLKEFSYGYETADALSDEVPEGSAPMRFFMNSLYQYCANYFLVGGGNKLRNLLIQLGSGDLLKAIDDLLATPFGGITFGEILRTFRDKFLTHQTFTFSPLEERIYDKCDLREPETGQRFSKLVNDLFYQTQLLYLALMERYPEAMDVAIE